MQKLKRYLTRPVCLILALVTLAVSMTVAALTGSPYDTLKDAAFNMVKIDNATVTMDMTASIDGIEEESQRMTVAFSKDAMLDQTGNNASYRSARYSLYPCNVSNGIPLEYRLQIYQDGQNDRDTFSPLSELSEYSRSDMYVRLGELCMDLLVGDLKNNIAISNNGDGKTLAMTLTAQQIPELYNALLTVAIAESTSMSGGYGDYYTDIGEYQQTRVDTKAMTKTITVYPFHKQYYDPETGENIEADDYRAREEHSWNEVDWSSPITSKTKTTPLTAADFADKDKMDQPFKDAVVDYAGFTVRLDKNDVLMDGRGDIRVKLTTIFGETVVIEASMNVTCENVGSTVPQMPVPGIEEIFTDEFVQSFIDAEQAKVSDEKMTEYFSSSSPAFTFSLNDDGTVDMSSIRYEGYPRAVAEDFAEEIPFDIEIDEASSIGIIGGADGPTSVIITE